LAFCTFAMVMGVQPDVPRTAAKAPSQSVSGRKLLRSAGTEGSPRLARAAPGGELASLWDPGTPARKSCSQNVSTGVSHEGEGAEAARGVPGAEAHSDLEAAIIGATRPPCEDGKTTTRGRGHVTT